jgi:hypothetical protein
LPGVSGRRPGAEDGREAYLKSVVEHLANVTERTQHIVRDEIELAKAEVSEKVASIGRGAAVGAAAGVFIALGGLFFLQGLAWLFAYVLFDNNQIFWGFFMTAALLFLAAAIGGLLAYRFVKKGAPPVPSMAIDEAKLIRESVQRAGQAHPESQHGPSRTLGAAADRGPELRGAVDSVVQQPAQAVGTRPTPPKEGNG